MVSYFDRMFSDETLLTGTWTHGSGAVVTSSVLPATWGRALERIGADLRVRQFNGTIAHIRFEAVHLQFRDYDEDDFVWLSSNVTREGEIPDGMGHSGDGVPADADEESIAVSCAGLLQDRIARSGIVWPRGRGGGFMGPILVEGSATWSAGHGGEHTAIGTLEA